MKRCKATWFQSWLPAGLMFSHAILLSAAPGAGWQKLFNGQDLSGWVKMHDGQFAAADGNLRLLGGMGWLRSEKQYKNFILELEWRPTKLSYDSGIFFQVGLEGKPWPTEAWQVNLSSDALGGLVQGSAPVVPARTRRKKPTEWTKFSLQVQGTVVTLKVNDEKSWEKDILDESKPGYIGIQAENHAFDFRHIRIREL